MPYIKDERKSMAGYPVFEPQTAGELNYAITQLLIGYSAADGGESYYLDTNLGKWTYQKINDVIGALEGAKMEFYRRVVVDYENQKAEMNGDVYA